MNPELLLTHFNNISDAPGAIPRLRRFIIDLAVRGKLVEQDADEEPAAQLLVRIQVEKARLVKEGKIRKQNVQPDVEPKSTPFAIPKNWIWTRLGDVIHLVSGQHLQPGEYSEDKEEAIWGRPLVWARCAHWGCDIWFHLPAVMSVMAARTKATGAEKAAWMLIISAQLVIEVAAIKKRAVVLMNIPRQLGKSVSTSLRLVQE